MLILLIAATMAWTVSLRVRDGSIADICWGPAFAATAWLYCSIFGAWTIRPLVVSTLVTVWGVRLGAHIFRRHRGEDARYQAMRAKYGEPFWWQSLFVVFWLQAAILWWVAMPLLMVARSPGQPYLVATDGVGMIVFVIGLAFEVVGDAQLRRFRSDPCNRTQVLDTGLWRYTRHPNYFGDALVWWGIFLIATAAPYGWFTFASPALMTFLLVRVSGVALLESTLIATKPGYAEYVRRTPAFVPWPRFWVSASRHACESDRRHPALICSATSYADATRLRTQSNTRLTEYRSHHGVFRHLVLRFTITVTYSGAEAPGSQGAKRKNAQCI